MALRRVLMVILFLMLIHHSNQKLIGLIQFTRHGARTPLKFYDVFEKDFFPFGVGELTLEGFRMAYDKGEMMRKEYSKFESSDPLRYINFVDELEKNPNLMKIFTSPCQRTILTSYGYLEGFFKAFNPVYEKNGELIDLKSLMKDRYTLPEKGKFLKETNRNPININKIAVKIFDEKAQYIYKPKCAILNKNQIKKKKEIIISDKDYKHVQKFKKEYPKLFDEYCDKYYKQRLAVDNIDGNKCPEELYKREGFLGEIAGIINSVNFHKKNSIDPELIKLTYTSYIKIHHERLNEYQAKVEGTNQIRYIKAILSNLKNCNLVDEKSSFTSNKFLQENDASNIEKNIISIESELNCKKYVLFSLHDDNIYAILRSLFDVNAKLYDLLKVFETSSYNEIRDWLDFYWPPYISDFSFQVHQDESSNEEYVRLYYNGKELKNLFYFNNNYNNVIYTENGIRMEVFLKYLESRIVKDIKYNNHCD